MEERTGPPPALPPGLSSEAAKVLAAIGQQRSDPFNGIVQRHVLAPEADPTEMEVLAARDAISRAGVHADDIDLLLIHTSTPTYLLSNAAALLHERLGLPRTCFALQTEAGGHSFLLQLSIAQAMIRTGQARMALLVQSSAATRLVDPNDRIAPNFGDAATAVVVGPTSTGGVLGSVQYADGRFPDTLVATTEAGTWYGAGALRIREANRAALFALLLQTIDVCKLGIGAVLAKTGVNAEDVGFFSIHQGTGWMGQLAKDACGMTRAHSIDTFARTGYIFAASLPMSLRIAQDQGLIATDDLVVLFGGGTGQTYGATVLRWGAHERRIV